MRTRFIPVLFVLLILLVGCSANKDLPQSTESAVSSDGIISEVQQDEQFTDEPTSAITETVASSTETEVVAKPDESQETISSESNKQTESQNGTETSKEKPTQSQTETVETEKEPTGTQPVKKPDEPVSQPTESETQAAEKPELTEPIESFNIDYWIDFANIYAQNKGLCLDSAAVDCWDNPIRAGSHCIYLERDIQSRLNRYANDEDITDVWIWFEDVGDDCYDIYIGYA